MAIVRRMIAITLHPDTFFEQVREETGWRRPLVHLLVLVLWLSMASVTAWALGLEGDTPINSSLGAQMDVYPYWRDVLLPQYGLASYPIAALFIALQMVIITAIFVPVIWVLFRYLGGAPRPGGPSSLLLAFQGFAYGLTPCAFGGFLPYVALVVGVYATVLQAYRGPAITLRNRSIVPYLFFSLFMAFAIARYWQHQLIG
jgi:hypothetical protein